MRRAAARAIQGGGAGKVGAVEGEAEAERGAGGKR